MRDLFHVPENYFLSHSVGCLPKQSEAALTEQFFAPWKTGTTWADWMPVFDEFRTGLAALLSVQPSTICPQVNVSSALTKILYSLPQHANRNVILLSKLDFPTIGFVFEQAARVGYEVRFIDGDPTEIETWRAAIDETVAIVHVTHATSNTSHLLPVQDICAVARTKGVTTIVDVAQSLGAVPVDPSAWGVDFAIGTGVKFLCFGPGACFLYAAPYMISQCNPMDVGWFSHENPFEMDIESFRYAPDALRFFGGTPSPAPFVLANAAMRVWNLIELDTVYARIDTCLSELCEKLPEPMIVSPMMSHRRGATLVIAPRDRGALQHNLSECGIHCDARKEGFRFSMHGYTSDAELDVLSRALLAAAD